MEFFRYVGKSILKGHLHHNDGLFAKRFFPADSLVAIYSGSDNSTFFKETKLNCSLAWIVDCRQKFTEHRGLRLDTF